MSSDLSPSTIGAIFGAISVAASWLMSTLALGWRTRGIVADINEKIETKVGEVKDEVRSDHDENTRNHGESLMAIRQKITDVEIWNRDNFVRRADFAAVVESINRSIETLSAKMHADMQGLRAELIEGQRRVEGKIDRLPQS
jgi:hypothetical protein